jgi:hypothetical protein
MQIGGASESLIERSFPKEMSIWISENDRTLLQWNLSSRAKPERGPLDYEALGNGRLVAVESFLHPSDEQQRFGWEDLPQGVHFVTIPLAMN